jgi:hypothetical protein
VLEVKQFVDDLPQLLDAAGRAIVFDPNWFNLSEDRPAVGSR